MIFLIIAAACLGCDPLANPVSGPVRFSSDTISFDTVFSDRGSVTMEFRAINKAKDPLLIDRIWLGGGSSSPFRININGVPGTSRNDVIIAKEDSLFVFVEVTIDPSGQTSPVAVTDSVVFESGTFIERVILEAWGQDIWLIGDDITGNAVWTKGKPYVINGSLLVDTAETLVLQAGTRVYFHHGASMTVAGSLVCEGTAEEPVLMATDRLEDVYKDVPGKWRGIRFLDCSKNNKLENTIVRNAQIAVLIKGTVTENPDLKLHGAQLIHNSVSSLVACHADIEAVNSIFAHTGFSTVSLSGKGSCNFIHCTLSDRWDYGFRSEPVMHVSKADGLLPEVTVINSVIDGNLDNELVIDAARQDVEGRFTADSSLIKIDTVGSTWYSTALFKVVRTTPVPKFIDASVYDFRPDTLSPLVDNAGKTEAVTWPFDIRNKPRPTGSGSDIGAYERQPGEKKKER